MKRRSQEPRATLRELQVQLGASGELPGAQQGAQGGSAARDLGPGG